MAPKQRDASPAARVPPVPGKASQCTASPKEPPPPAKAAPPTFKRQTSIYALTPDRRWLRPSWAFPLYAAALGLTLLLCFVWQPSYELLRLQYTFVGVGLLLYRVYYYAHKERILYFIDLCFVSSIFLIWSLWFCTDGRCSQEWLWAVYLVAQGPVAGATFPLQTPLTLHHPEAFESFFLHASPMWISYAVRWRWAGFETIPSVGQLVAAAFWKIFFPWFIAYLIFLLVQPFLPDKIAGYETLVDGLILPSLTTEQRLNAKRQKYSSYAKGVLMATSLHAVLSSSGFLAAALAFQYHEVQIVWILCVFMGCLISGARFYYQSAHPQYVAPGQLQGFINMSIAWAFVLPTYCPSAGRFA
ncbi:Glycerophosphocholine acyltransferase 1 [Durusdinium trenchii]|uniref:Glycerophosphocholine acyltransferase 1 n=1 Tax=Durusdinium trenchii TaxID=1381693 RepID=A0ABP0LM08_9DINO